MKINKIELDNQADGLRVTFTMNSEQHTAAEQLHQCGDGEWRRAMHGDHDNLDCYWFFDEEERPNMEDLPFADGDWEKGKQGFDTIMDNALTILYEEGVARYDNSLEQYFIKADVEGLLYEENEHE